MLPQFVSLGPLTLNLYALLIGLAALGALAWVGWRARDGRIVVSALVIALAALAFGRAGTVALNWEYFREHGTEIVSLAGLSEHAAILGGLFGWAVCRGLWADARFTIGLLLTTAFILLAVAASIGCIPNGCAHGREVFWQTDGEASLAWLLRADWPDATLVNNPRWPTQALLAGWVVAGAAILILTGARRCVTLSPLHVIIVFAVGDFLVQFLRADPALMVGGWRIYQWFDLVLAALVIVVLSAKKWARV